MNLNDLYQIKQSCKMSFDLRDYIKIYDDVIDRSLCNELIEEINKQSWSKHGFYNGATGEIVHHQDELSVCHASGEAKDKLQHQLWFVIEKYILQDHAFMDQWFSGWTGYTAVRFNKYTENTQMHVHCDHIQSMFDGQRKGIPFLSIVGLLNNDYEGGDFVMWNDVKMAIKPGSVMMFPSNFLYPHCVNPVTKGARYSYVSWVW